jgi:hypothetical protein
LRRAFPYFATFVLVGILAAVFVLRPTPFIGVTAGSMASSLGGKLPATGAIDCTDRGEDEWSCAASGATPARDRDYDVTVNGFGCWTATPAGGTAEVGTPATITGCISVFDH